MERDDMIRIIYCILKELYECTKQGVKVNKADINHERFRIPYSYWLDILIEMQKRGYIEGVLYRMTKGTGRVVNYDDIAVTLEGVEYLANNSSMNRVKEALKDIKDIVPMI